jgi:hypothetical protein
MSDAVLSTETHANGRTTDHCTWGPDVLQWAMDGPDVFRDEGSEVGLILGLGAALE